MGKKIDKHRVFADAYLVSQLETEKDRIAEAEEVAGYKPGGGARLLRLADVREYIELKRLEIERSSIVDPGDSEEIADSDKVAAFFTAVMNAGSPDRFSSADLRDQMKAAEFLAKYHDTLSKEQTGKKENQSVIISGGDDLES